VITTKCIISSLGLAALLASPAVFSPVNAAVISGVVSADFSGNTTYDLTSLGTLDWAYWNLAANPTTGVPTNSKNGATLIGSATAVGGGNVRGSTTTTGSVPESYFTFSDGTTTASATTGVMSTGIFNTQLATLGAGVSLMVDLPTVQTYTVYIWASAFSLSSSTFTASLNGATSFVSSALVDNTSSSSKDTYLITLTVTPDNPGDDLVITAIAGNSLGASSHVLISGIAVSATAIPEPGTAGFLAGIAALGVGAIARRRQRAPGVRV
jgi:hypothetical protein